MLIEKINRELIKAINETGLTPIDDLEYINANTVFINELHMFNNSNTKDINKESYYVVLQLYENDTSKLDMYRNSQAFKSNFKELFPDMIDEYKLNYKIIEEASQKVFSDVGKFYQYTIEMTITAYKVL